MRDRTTDLDELREYPSRFTWGQIEHVYDIGEYTIAAFYPYAPNSRKVQDDIAYHGWINGRSTSQRWSTLDAALVGLIGLKHDGENSQAAMFFMRMIEAD